MVRKSDDPEPSLLVKQWRHIVPAGLASLFRQPFNQWSLRALKAAPSSQSHDIMFTYTPTPTRSRNPGIPTCRRPASISYSIPKKVAAVSLRLLQARKRYRRHDNIIWHSARCGEAATLRRHETCIPARRTTMHEKKSIATVRGLVPARINYRPRLAFSV